MKNKKSGKSYPRVYKGLNRKNRKFNIFSKIWSVLFSVSTVAFIVTVWRVGLLPDDILYIGTGVLVVLSILLSCTLWFGRIKNKRKVIALIFSIILMATMGYLSYNLFETTGFFSKVTTGVDKQQSEYLVVVRDDDIYSNIEDLENNRVFSLSKDDKRYQKAEEKLLKKVLVSMEYNEDLLSLGSDLIKCKEDAILVSEGHYRALEETISDFGKKTKVLYRFSVPIISSRNSKAVSVCNEPFNIYISGLDTRGNIDVVSRSDVNMIMTINPKTHKILLTTIPRDYIISLTERGGVKDKLTHTGMYGMQQTLESVENLTGLDMNYFLKVNYTTVNKFINAIGGVDVNSEFAFSTHGQNAQYYFTKGINHMDGDKALAFARERKSFVDGDLQRNRNQALLIEAIIKKASSSTTILSRYASILEACKDCLQINMSQDDIKELIKMQIDGGYHWNVETQNFTGTPISGTCYSMGNASVSMVEPDFEDLRTKVANIWTVLGKEERLPNSDVAASVPSNEAETGYEQTEKDNLY